MPSRPYGMWEPDETRLQCATAECARDLVVDWFAATQGSHFEATKSALGVPTHDASIIRTVKGAVRLAFRRTGGDFDRPTRESVVKAMNHLAERSLGWGAPPDEVLDHHAAILRVIERLPRAQN